MRRLMRRKSSSLAAALYLLAAVLPGAPSAVDAQERGAAAVDQLVRSLSVTGRVLMIAAHPDDEDTRLIAWLSRGRGVETAYLSLTRGDGGQNLIGNELGDALGAIRTEELLAARRIDGGRQYFTRAFDFGFSKNAEETYKHWPHDSLLGDVVTVIRAYRPHVVVSVWSGTATDGHGHHTVAGLLAREAYDAAGDTVRFPVKKFGAAWEPAKFYRTTGFNRLSPSMQINVGEFDPVLGRSYAEIAAESRGQHRSQGFGGVQQPKGALLAGVVRQASRVNEITAPKDEQSIFDGVDTTFARLSARKPGATNGIQRSALRDVIANIDSARATADLRRPGALLAWLGRATEAVQGVRASTPRCWRLPPTLMMAGAPPAPSCDAEQLDFDASIDVLNRRMSEAVLAASGVAIDAVAPKELLAFGDSMRVNVSIFNRGKSPVSVLGVKMTGRRPGTMAPAVLAPDSSVSLLGSVIGLVDSRPWWTSGREGNDIFAPHQSPADGVARVSSGPSTDVVPGVAVAEDIRRESNVEVTLKVGFATVTVNAGPIVYRFSDPVLGQQDRPVSGVPPLTLKFDRGLEWMPANKAIDRRITLTLTSHSDTRKEYSWRLQFPSALKLDSLPEKVMMEPFEQKQLFLRIRGTLPAKRYEFGIVAVSETGLSYEGVTTIQYPHILPVRTYRSSAFYLQAVDIAIPKTLSVAYVQGVGDVVAPFLPGLEVPMVTVSPAELAVFDLSRYSTLVIGARAFEAHRDLMANRDRVMDFARKGGTVVVQYGQFEMQTPGVLPYPIQLKRPAERVTEEKAEVTVLDPKSRLLNFPNKLGPDDWKGWTQERALYMPSVIDPRYATPLEMHDPGEPENKGAILMTSVGKGTFIYTTLSLFRQIPGGVDGGPRLLVNLLSAGLDIPAKKAQP